MSHPPERQRRHDERWQKEMLDGLARIHTVLHDISDGIRELIDSTPQPAPAATDTVAPQLMSVAALAEHLGLSRSAVYALRSAGHAPPETRLGSRVLFQRADVDAWLAELRSPRSSGTQRWSAAHLSGRIGSAHPASSAPAPYCTGSHTEPLAASQYSGRVVCRVCRDDVLVNRDGRTRKHRPYFR